MESERELVVYADYVCPFCYLGKASLDRYLERREGPLTVEWRPFDLRAGKRGPDGAIDHSVDDGKDDAYFAEARRNVERLAERYDVEMARPLAREVDSRNAHAAALAVRERGEETFEAFHAAIYDALWHEERDVGDPAVLSELAEGCGVDPDLVASALSDEDLDARLDRAFAAAHERGISGVPTFVSGGHAAAGAIPPDQLRRLVEGVAQ
ncbi:DsbA family oxidoreductase [Natronorarus salvus]|uniref:DsbA family oxidoreductase n=1 Tax=Natronorarus salvus TaxID=3117733 RepID=UPI002F263B51